MRSTDDEQAVRGARRLLRYLRRMSEPPVPPFVPPYGLSTSSGTWDDWLAMRPEPRPAPGENAVDITQADFVASVLVRGAPEVLDFGFAPVRDGMRDLFAEFESSTGGQTVLFRKGDADAQVRESKKVEITVVRTDEDRVRLAMATDAGQPLAADLDLEQAFQIADRIISAIKAIQGDGA